MRYMLITSTQIILKIDDQDDGTCLLTQYLPDSADYQSVLLLVTEEFTPPPEVPSNSIFTPI